MNNTCQMEKKKKLKSDKKDFPERGFFEAQAWKNQSYLCGIDEVGRGCLAGPIVTACVILPPFCDHPLLVDSKILSEKKRLEAYEWLIKHAWFTISLLDHYSIDQINIYKATQICMKKTLYMMLSLFEHTHLIQGVVIDAMPLALPEYAPFLECFSHPKGEYWSPSIAAASIIAKVTRDRLITHSNTLFPGYTLDKHKGYGTADHTNQLLAKGPSLIHRKSFLKNFIFTPHARQHTIF